MLGALKDEPDTARIVEWLQKLNLSTPTNLNDDWVTRRVSSAGVVRVSMEQFYVGQRHRGKLVNVHVTDENLEFWLGGDLIRTVGRTSKRRVVMKRARGTRP